MQLYIAGNFQVVVIRREKNSKVYLKNFTDFFKTDVFSFSLTDPCLPSWRCKACALRSAANHLVGSETPKHNAFDDIGKIF